MDLRGERVLALFLLLAMFYVLLFISFTIFSWVFSLSKGHTHERRKVLFTSTRRC